jgi:hypothetical protein
VSIDESETVAGAKRLQHIMQLFTVCPDLAMMYAVNAFAQYLARLIASADSHHAGAERFDYLLPFATLEQQNAPHRRPALPDLPQKFETAAGSINGVDCYESDIGLGQ